MKDTSVSLLADEATLMHLSLDDVPHFVSDCVRQKRLSGVMKYLNKKVLFGSADEKAEARDCLSKLGFL